MNENLINYLRSRGLEPTPTDIEFFNQQVGQQVQIIADFIESAKKPEVKTVKRNLRRISTDFKCYKYVAHKNVLDDIDL